jgi:membrane protease subunit (stomatin/prohibitin family)
VGAVQHGARLIERVVASLHTIEQTNQHTVLAQSKRNECRICSSTSSYSDLAEAGISKNYCATNSGSPEVELRFCPWLILFTN